MLHMKTLAEIPSVIVVIKYKMFRIKTETWKLQILIKRMDSEIFLYLQYLYKGKWYSTIHFNFLWIINFLSRWNKLHCTNFCTHSIRITCARRGGVVVAGLTVDREIRIRFLAYSHCAWVLWWQGGSRVWVARYAKDPSCPWRWVTGSRSKVENWTTVPSLYSWM